MNKLISTLAIIAVLTVSGIASAQPVQDISGKRHPNLSAAQHLTDQAFQRVVAAQQANEFDMNGHAQKAKELLDQANIELKAAAETANHR